MFALAEIKTKKVFEYFEKISSIPRSSGNMIKIADFCMNFAEEHFLKAIKDESNNVIIFKDASKGYENSEPIILQGHLDMVCQKSEYKDIDFLNEGLELYVDGDYVKAKGTTLGADNGIAVAMILAILDSDDISHPAIEAVFTADEEIGMIGATALDTSVLKSKRMINLDSEDMDCMTVSCAGGSDFTSSLSIIREKVVGKEFTINIKGLNGGHSGICIHEGRVNANILAGRILNYLNKSWKFGIISVNGGDKDNAIPLACEVKLCVENGDDIKRGMEKYIEVIKDEIIHREPAFHVEMISGEEEKEFYVIGDEFKNKLIFALCCTPNGVIDMSKEIDGLVETSLNLGVLKTEYNEIIFSYALRSNKKSALNFLEEKLKLYFDFIGALISVGGHYPPWEFNTNSVLQSIYLETYEEQFGELPRVEAIHAGLECGIFADKIKGFDCIAIGPQIYDVHTVNERLSISSTEKIYKLLIKILEKCL